MEQAVVDTDLDARLEETYSRQAAAPLVRTSPKTSFKDRYKTIERLGDGSQGHVFRVKEVATGETYILKKILIPFDHDEVVKENVEREVQSLRRLNHPAIPKLVQYEVEENSDDLWEEHLLLMEDNGGTSLDKKWKQRGPFAAAEVEKIESQSLEALAHAHSQGVIHRDLKPENVLADEDGQVTIIDWGVAKFDVQKTRIGTLGVVGTPGYMAPEQMGGKGKTGKITDLYGLAATLIAARRGVNLAEHETADDLANYVGELFTGEQRDRLKAMVIIDPEERQKKFRIEDGSYVFADRKREVSIAQPLAVPIQLPTVPGAKPIKRSRYKPKDSDTSWIFKAATGRNSSDSKSKNSRIPYWAGFLVGVCEGTGWMPFGKDIADYDSLLLYGPAMFSATVGGLVGGTVGIVSSNSAGQALVRVPGGAAMGAGFGGAVTGVNTAWGYCVGRAAGWLINICVNG